MNKRAAFWAILLAASVCSKSRGQDSSAPLDRYDPVWGTVTKSRGDLAEFDISLKHGLQVGQRLSVFPSDTRRPPVGMLKVLMVDEHQAIGRFDKGILPQLGQRVLFYKHRPVAALDSPINSLIGKVCRLELYASSTPPYSRLYQVRVMDVVALSDNEISSVAIVANERDASANVAVNYNANVIYSLTSNDCAFVLDRQAGCLVTQQEYLARSQKRQIEAVARAQAQEAEATRLQAEARHQSEVASQPSAPSVKGAGESPRVEVSGTSASARLAGTPSEPGDHSTQTPRIISEAPQRPVAESVETQREPDGWDRAEELAGEYGPVLVEGVLRYIASVITKSPVGPASSSGKVHVRGYYRGNGTYVRPYDRSYPGTKK